MPPKYSKEEREVAKAMLKLSQGSMKAPKAMGDTVVYSQKKGGALKKGASNPWLKHLKEFYAKNKGKMSYKEAMKEAKKTYKK